MMCDKDTGFNENSQINKTEGREEVGSYERNGEGGKYLIWVYVNIAKVRVVGRNELEEFKMLRSSSVLECVEGSSTKTRRKEQKNALLLNVGEG